MNRVKRLTGRSGASLPQWNLLGAALLVYLGKRGIFQRGQTFWAYVAWYGFGRLLIEAFLRIDTAEMLLGVHIHVWTSGAILLLGLIMFVFAGARARRHRDELETAAVRAGD